MWVKVSDQPGFVQLTWEDHNGFLHSMNFPQQELTVWAEVLDAIQPLLVVEERDWKKLQKRPKKPTLAEVRRKMKDLIKRDMKQVAKARRKQP